MANTKVIAMYLPQYHCIPENDEFWGKGFTDWTTVRKARPLFEGHNQPRIPLQQNYYDLSQKENVKWQAQLAKDNGIYGFGVYHYWFNNEKNLLTKPAEIIRDNDDVDINYFLAWDNGNWKRSWSNVDGNAWSPLADNNNQEKGPAILIPYILGNEKDWENHYRYLRTHFLKEKYIKIDNKPIFIIFNYSCELVKMNAYWNKLAQEDGFQGVHIIYRNFYPSRIKTNNIPNTEYKFNYEPSYNGWFRLSFKDKVLRKIRKILGIKRQPSKYSIYDYDQIWKTILHNAKNEYSSSYVYHGAFVDYDDTPRRGDRGGKLILGATPGKFANYMSQLIKISEEQGKEFVFLTAWNEWGEGAYLEPDTQNNMSYLEALRSIK